jgi:hypothetical protein
MTNERLGGNDLNRLDDAICYEQQSQPIDQMAGASEEVTPEKLSRGRGLATMFGAGVMAAFVASEGINYSHQFIDALNALKNLY